MISIVYLKKCGGGLHSIFKSRVGASNENCEESFNYRWMQSVEVS
jgi:hypothetical protein